VRPVGYRFCRNLREGECDSLALALLVGMPVESPIADSTPTSGRGQYERPQV